MSQRWAPVLVCLFLSGCGAFSSPGPSAAPARGDLPASREAQQASDAPLSRQVAQRIEPLDATRFSGLLHFEDESDALFIAADMPVPRVDGSAQHTGESSLLLADGTQRLTVKLSSLLAGRDFPGEWTLLGLYLRPHAGDALLTLTCAADGQAIATRQVTAPAGEWTAAMLDIAALSKPPRGELTLEVRFDRPVHEARVDDVLLIDNRQTLVDAGPDGWTIERAGLRVTCQRPSRFTFSLVTPYGSPQGWEVQEANALRARFTSQGEAGDLTVYADGRSFWDGAYKPLSAEVRDDEAFAAAHAAPAEITMPETMGRVTRNTPGDANNDGYNERLGAYLLHASGGRLELTMTPRGTLAPRPVLQIAGLPEGKPLITIEGRLVEESVRLDDGQLLVELPARITRPTLVSVRIQ